MAKDNTLWPEEEMANSQSVIDIDKKKLTESLQSKKEVVTLNMADKKEYKECIQYFKSDVNDSTVDEITRFLVSVLKNKDIVLKSLDGEVVSNKLVDKYLLERKVKRTDRCGFVALFFSDTENIKCLIDDLCPPEVKKIIVKLLDCFYISAEDLYREKAGKILLSKHKYWAFDEFDLNYPWFSLYSYVIPERRYANSREVFMSIHHDLFHFFFKAYGEEVALTRKNLSEEEGLNVLCTEASIVAYYPILLNLYKQKVLVTGKNDRVLVSTIRKCAKQVTLDEFFPSSEDSNLKIFRATCAFSLFYDLFVRQGKKTVALHNLLLQNLFSMLVDGEHYTLLLPHIKGLPSDNFLSLEYRDLIEDIWDILHQKECADQWFSVRGIFNNLLRVEGGFAHLHLFQHFEFSSINLRIKNSLHGDENIDLFDLKDDFFQPYVRGVLVMLASVGILDVAYREFSNVDRSWVDWLEYVRLTDLGKYVLGISETYESKDINNPKNSFVLESDRLILRCLENDSPFVSYLEDVALPIGNQRYVFSYEKFLKNVIYKSDVENKIDFFKQFICDDLPQIWADFFKNLKDHCHPMQTVSNQNFTIFKLNPENKELLHILSTDAELKEMVIRAEGYMILVENSNKSNFSKRLRTLGFLL